MSDIDRSLEDLLGKASPRPVPKPADAAAAREAVRAEWRNVSGKYRSRKRMVHFAVAATILISVFSIFNSYRLPDPGAVQVASIQKRFGTIYVLGKQSQLTPADDLAAIHAGQIIVTGDDAGIALAWGLGGSVRMNKDTKVEFIDDNTVHLWSGQIYFDSAPSGLVAGISAGGVDSFEIESDYGLVLHVGTQFMTEVEPGELIVSVREGQVDIIGRHYPYTAAKGEQVTFRGRERPVALSFPEYGAAWDWIGHTSPSINVDGKSVYDFLHWAGRELGREVIYGSDSIEQDAKTEKFHGDVNTAPADALRLRMATTDIEWKYDEGAIYVGEAD